MAEYLSPGVYVEEIEIGAKPIEGVSTSTVGFLGETERGPTTPRFVTSWTQYQRVYGSYFGADKYLPYAVEGFFKNGGQRCYLGRIVGGITNATAAAASSILKDKNGNDTLEITAVGGGKWGNNIAFKVENGTQNPAKEFKLTLYYWKDSVPDPYFDPIEDSKSTPRPSVVEVYDDLSMDSSSHNFYEKKINEISNLITIKKTGTSTNKPKSDGGSVISASNAAITLPDLDGVNNNEIIVFNTNSLDGQTRKIIDIDNTGNVVTIDQSLELADINKTVLVVQEEVASGEIKAIDISSKKITLASEINIGSNIFYLEVTSGDAKGKIYKIKDTDTNDKSIIIIDSFGTDPKPKKDDFYRIFKVVEKTITPDNDIKNATVQLDTTASNINDAYKDMFVVVEKDGKKQTNTIIAYDGTTQTATVQKSWDLQDPVDNTFSYMLCCGTLSGGKETNITLGDYQGKDDKENSTGLAAFTKIDDISILYSPDSGNLAGLTATLITHCENLKDRFAIIDAPEKTPVTVSPRDKFDTKYGAYYYPWIKIIDPQNGMKKLIPPGGYMAGIYARSDVERGVHKAPANEVVRGVVDLEFPVTKGDQDILNPRGVNCVRAFPGRGIRVWGARTLSSDPLWKYINIRRLFIYLEESIDEGTQWVVFEPNSEILWARVIQTISNFLKSVWKSGALMGLTPEEAFFVKCDRTTMTQDDIDNGRLIVMIGVAPVKPAEFVIFRIAQWTNNAE
ncbi:phage tail sheath subtilisin-like domain-containing protein [Sulfurovum sp.]|uniref:phage tail sheath family protein n=1 Tax=Sulfurovum sp. TaxID=1969726 RepID=UPI0025E7D609|nr:phage tail sheath subtilisin-like domain-containing protein [Sulfurovum sp.]